MKKWLVLCFLALNAHAISLQEIKTQLLAQPVPSMDSAWIEIQQKVVVNHQSTVQKLKIVSLGQNQMRTEMDGPMGKMLIVRQGEWIKTKMGANGQVTKQRVPQGAPSPAMNPVQTLAMMFGDWNFEAPVKEGNYWKLVSKSNLGLPDLVSRTLWYHPTTKRVEKFQDQNTQGAVTMTTIEFCKTNCAFTNAPSKIWIESQVMGQKTNLEMEFLQMRKVKSLPAGYFDL
jgi:hypothetical protein